MQLPIEQTSSSGNIKQTVLVPVLMFRIIKLVLFQGCEAGYLVQNCGITLWIGVI